MKIAAVAALCSLGGGALAHPGNGIVALSETIAITGDATGNGIWKFEVGKTPRRLVDRFHCHWVTRGLDGAIYAETLHETGGAWESGVYQLEPDGARPTIAIRNHDLGSLMFTVALSGAFVFARGTTMMARLSNGTVGPFRGSKAGDVADPSAYAWGPDNMLFIADGDSILKLPATGPMRTVTRFQGHIVASLYAGPNRAAKVWGLDVDQRGGVIAAIPSLSKVIRLDSKGDREVLARGQDGWQPVGVSASRSSVFILESKTEGNRNYGPRVRVVRSNGKIEELGTANR